MLKLIPTPELAHQYQVVREDGLPDVVLTLFAEGLLKSLSPSSVPIYMREVLSAFNWAVDDKVVAQNRWSLFGSPVEVRNIVREYLTVGAKCKLRRRPDRLGVKVTYVHPSQDTRINVRIFLAALRRFYDYLIADHRYQHPNPLVHEDMSKVAAELRQNYRRAIKEMEGREPMPAASGVDPPSGIRLSANYFRCVEEEWLPKTIDDPDFPHLVYNAGKQCGWGLRELCVVRILFESGARISEVFDLTAKDWAVSQFLTVFEARNKGSFGVRTKRLVVSSVTAKLCRRYFDDDKDGRRAHDPQRLTIADLSRMDGPALEQVKLFVSERGVHGTAIVFEVVSRLLLESGLAVGGHPGQPAPGPSLVRDQCSAYDRADIQGCQGDTSAQDGTRAVHGVAHGRADPESLRTRRSRR